MLREAKATAQWRDLLVRKKIGERSVRARAFLNITDSHLGKLARANGARLATLDENIAGSFLIPK